MPKADINVHVPKFLCCPQCLAVRWHLDLIDGDLILTCLACGHGTTPEELAKRAADLPAGLNCPLCGTGAVGAISDGEVAFCGAVACPVITWEPAKTQRENISHLGPLKIGPAEPAAADVPEGGTA